MPLVSLTPDQINQIEQDIKMAGIRFSHLETDLLDHICCYVEELMVTGISFEKALQKAKREFNYQKLKEIEIQTILLINKNFEIMKTMLKISGIGGFILAFLGYILKMNHWPGASILVILAFIMLSFAYIPSLLLTVKREKILKKSLHLFYTGALAAFLTFLAILFKIMHWPYGSYLVLSSQIATALFFVLVFLASLRDKENRIVNMSVVLVLTVFFLFTSVLVFYNQKNPKIFYGVYESALKENADFMQKQNTHLYGLLESSVSDSALKEQCYSLSYESGNIAGLAAKLKTMIFESEEERRQYSENYFKKYVLDDNAMEPILQELFKETASFKEHLMSLSSDHGMEDLYSFIDKNLSISKFEMSGINPLVMYNMFERLVRDIRLCENQLLTSILLQTR
ncbi:MAG: hypothetical protein EHM20_07905 [Alphaproteobacteria bacterium]|nr:MAG: hypothetical protein EHM20_07905 [Alphaproteobacteria bacterium]